MLSNNKTKKDFVINTLRKTKSKDILKVVCNDTIELSKLIVEEDILYWCYNYTLYNAWEEIVEEVIDDPLTYSYNFMWVEEPAKLDIFHTFLNSIAVSFPLHILDSFQIIVKEKEFNFVRYDNNVIKLISDTNKYFLNISDLYSYLIKLEDIDNLIPVVHSKKIEYPLNKLLV